MDRRKFIQGGLLALMPFGHNAIAGQDLSSYLTHEPGPFVPIRLGGSMHKGSAVSLFYKDYETTRLTSSADLKNWLIDTKGGAYLHFPITFSEFDYEEIEKIGWHKLVPNVTGLAYDGALEAYFEGREPFVSAPAKGVVKCHTDYCNNILHNWITIDIQTEADLKVGVPLLSVKGNNYGRGYDNTFKEVHLNIGKEYFKDLDETVEEFFSQGAGVWYDVGTIDLLPGNYITCTPTNSNTATMSVKYTRGPELKQSLQIVTPTKDRKAYSNVSWIAKLPEIDRHAKMEFHASVEVY